MRLGFWQIVWRIFSGTIDLEPKKVVKIVMASCTLHNYKRKKNHPIMVLQKMLKTLRITQSI